MWLCFDNLVHLGKELVGFIYVQAVILFCFLQTIQAGVLHRVQKIAYPPRWQQ